MREISYRVGGKQPRNVYRVTPAHPEGEYIGVFFDDEDAALVVAAMNEAEMASPKLPVVVFYEAA